MADGRPCDAHYRRREGGIRPLRPQAITEGGNAMSALFEPIDAALVPRFAGIPSFMRLPVLTDPSLVDVALVGVPFDGGTTNRPGARHGPREIRNQSSLMRRINANGISPYARLRVADLGDAPVNPIDVMDSLAKIEGFFSRLQ